HGDGGHPVAELDRDRGGGKDRDTDKHRAENDRSGAEDRAAEATVVRESDPDGAPVLRVTGELDVSNAATLQASAASVLAARPERVIFNLSGLRYMDSAGIAVLLGVAAQVNTVNLRNPSVAVRRVVEVTGLTDVLPVEP